MYVPSAPQFTMQENRGKKSTFFKPCWLWGPCYPLWRGDFGYLFYNENINLPEPFKDETTVD